MQPLAKADIAAVRKVRFVLTDMDETLTYKGQLSAETYAALEDLQSAGVNTERGAVLYTGGSTNNARMFSFFEHTVAVSTVTNYFDDLPDLPRWITKGPAGSAFVEAAKAVIASRF